MKKKVILILVIVLLFNLCACVGEPADNTSDPGNNLPDTFDTFYFIGEFDREDLNLEVFEEFFLANGYTKHEEESDKNPKTIAFTKSAEDITETGVIMFYVYEAAEEAKAAFRDEPLFTAIFKERSHCRINNMVIYSMLNGAMNELVSHFGLEAGFRNIIVDEEYAFETVCDVLEELGFKVYGNSQIYDVVSPSGRTVLNIVTYETSQEFESACVNWPIMLSDKDHLLGFTYDPNTTTLAFRQGKFILIGNMDWLHLVRTRLEQAAA